MHSFHSYIRAEAWAVPHTQSCAARLKTQQSHSCSFAALHMQLRLRHCSPVPSLFCSCCTPLALGSIAQARKFLPLLLHLEQCGGSGMGCILVGRMRSSCFHVECSLRYTGVTASVTACILYRFQRHNHPHKHSHSTSCIWGETWSSSHVECGLVLEGVWCVVCVCVCVCAAFGDL